MKDLLQFFKYDHLPDNLAMVWTQFPTMDLMEFDASAPEFWEYQEQNRAFEILAGYDTDQINITGGDRPEKLEAAQVTGEFFEVLGVPALQGRVFSAEDDAPGAETVAVISEGLWRRRFAGGAAVLRILIPSRRCLWSWRRIAGGWRRSRGWRMCS